MVRQYNMTDYTEIADWFQQHDIPIKEAYIPEYGFIEPGIAAGFIYQTDANFCIFECFISNPKAPQEERIKALKNIVKQMIIEARAMGYQQVFGFATSQTMIKIGMENDFKFVETCSTIVKDL